jgi:hypothetical protein
MAGIRVNPYPKDRTPHHLYANLTFEDKAAEMDLRSGKITIRMPEHAGEAATAIVDWCIRNPHLVAAAKRTSRQVPVTPEGDLAKNRPGQNLIAVERAAREADRRRSRAWTFFMELLRVDSGLPYRRGMKGEQRVGRVADRLGKRGSWRALHSIPLGGGGDIDHLLIGPDGVVLIDTKYHRRARISVSERGIWVNGAPTDDAKKVRELAPRVQELLSTVCGFDVRVTPMVVLVNGGINAPELKSSGHPKGLLVATNWNLPRVLWDVEDGLLDEQVEAIYAAARRPETWAAKRTAK